MVRKVFKEVIDNMPESMINVFYSSLPDIVNNVIFNPLITGDGNFTLQRDELKQNKIVHFLANKVSESKDGLVVFSKKSFFRYGWISFQGDEDTELQPCSILPFEYLVYAMTRKHLELACLEVNSVEPLPEGIVEPGKENIAITPGYVLGLLDSASGLHIQMNVLAKCVNRCLEIILLELKEDEAKRMIHLALSDKSSGVSIIELYQEAMKMKQNGFFSRFTDTSSDTVKTMSELTEKFYKGQVDGNVYSALAYLIGFKFLVRLRNE